MDPNDIPDVAVVDPDMMSTMPKGLTASTGMDFNKECTGEKYKAIAEAFGVDTTGMDQDTYRQAAIDAVQQLSVDVGIPTKLEALKEEDLPFLCESAAADACAPGNPREATLEDFEMLFRKLM